MDYCLGIPDKCTASQNCDLLLTITSNGKTGGTVDFQLIGTPQENTNGWISVALSLDNKMGSDSVVECLALKNGNNEVTSSWNDGHKNIPIGDIEGITADTFVNADGLLNCKWSRTIKTTVHNTIFDLNTTEYYLLLAKGAVDDNGKLLVP